MSDTYFFTEFMVKERQQQLDAEADRSRLLRTVRPNKANIFSQLPALISRFSEKLWAEFFQKDSLSTCRCR